MSLGLCAFLGSICTVLSYFVWPFLIDYLLKFLPDISFIPNKFFIIAAAILFFILFSICFFNKNKTLSKFSFFLMVPLFFGIMFYFGDKTVFLAQEWWMTLLAAGAGLILLVVSEIILNAMDVKDHIFAFWLAIVFFIGVAIGLFFLMKMMINDNFASVFSSCAIQALIFTGWISDFFPE